MEEKITVSFKNVDIIFGKKPQTALPYLQQNLSREEILEKTGQVLGVADASLDVFSGEICVLMGLSGSGKSTLLRAVNGLNRVIRGDVIVNDGEKNINVASCDDKTLRKLRMHTVSMVFQQFALLPWRTVKENVGLGLELQRMPANERLMRVEKQLELVGLSKWANKYAHELSGGMQQRVGLARAFVTDADILLMDEPFSALDPLIRDRLQDELLDLQAKLNKTIVFVSHDLDEALKIGSKIAIMESGRIVQYASPEEIVLNPANNYVAEFVAHMNPLNVLTSRALMQPVDKLKRLDKHINIDELRNLNLILDENNHPASVADDIGEYKIQTTNHIIEDGFNLSENTIACAGVDLRMKDIIKARHLTGLPVLITDHGKFVGLIGDNEIYEGILRQSEPALTK